MKIDRTVNEIKAVPPDMKTISTANNSPQKWTLLMAVFMTWSFVMICRPQDYLEFLGLLRPGLILGAAAGCLWFFNSNSEEKVNGTDIQMKLYGCLILVMMISVPFSYYPRLSLKGLIGYCSVILFVFLFYRLINSPAKIRRMLFCYSIGITAYGLAILTKGDLMEERIYFGTMFDPNDIAFYMISFISFNLLFMSSDNSALVRLISLVSILLGLIIILKTGSRGGLIALMVMLFFLLFKRNGHFKISILYKGLLVLLAGGALLLADPSMARYRTIMDYKDDYNATDETGRLAIWKRGMKIMADHPVTGVGFDSFPEGIGRDREASGLDSAKWQAAHNSLVQIGAETGIFGFILYLALSINAYRIFTGVGREAATTWLAKLGYLSQAGFVGHFISAMFLSQAYSVYWAFYITLSAVLSRMRVKPDNIQGSSSWR